MYQLTRFFTYDRRLFALIYMYRPGIAPQSSLCEICGGQNDTGTGFYSRTSVFPCQYHSTIAPYSFIHLPPTLYNVFLPSTSVFPCQYHPTIGYSLPLLAACTFTMIFTMGFGRVVYRRAYISECTSYMAGCCLNALGTVFAVLFRGGIGCLLKLNGRVL